MERELSGKFSRSLIGLLVLLCFSSCFKDLDKRNNPDHKGHKDFKKAYHYDNGQVKKLLTFRDGYMHGQAVGYYPEGQIRWTVPYKYGKRHGIQRIYYRNGRLYSKATFAEGLLTGVVKQYRPDGRIQYKIPCRRGRISGTIIRYNYYRPKKEIPAGNDFEPVVRKESLPPSLWSDDDIRCLDTVMLPEGDSLPEMDTIKNTRAPVEDKKAKDLPMHRSELDLPSGHKLPDDSESPAAPGGSFVEDEAWKFETLQKDQDYEDIIREGI